MQDRNYDYRQMLGYNLLPTRDQDPWHGETPTNERDYRAYKAYHENFMRATALAQGIESDEGFIKFTATCSARDAKGNPIIMRKQRDEHYGADVCFCCAHVVLPDPVHPEPIYLLPFDGKMRDETEAGASSGYLLCGTCYKLMEKRKLNLGRDLCGKCVMCVAEAVTEVIQKDPTLFRDLTIRRL